MLYILYTTMEYNDFYDPNDNENNVCLNRFMKEEEDELDIGYNVFWRKITRPDGTRKRVKFEFYTSGDAGSQIRNAETGHYYKELVGSRDENMYFKVIIATGECNSKNGSNVLFFNSPDHYMRFFKCTLSDEKIKLDWEEKKNTRLNQVKAIRC